MLPAVAAAKDCREYQKVGRGLYLQTFDKTDVTGGVAGLPDRITTDLAPGQSGRVCVGFQNRTGKTIHLRFAAHDFGAGRDGSPVPFATGKEAYGAGSWLRLPPEEQVALDHGDLIWLDVGVDLPADTAGGSAYAGVSASLVDPVASKDPATGNQTKITPSVVVQVFFDVPGDITDGGHVQDVRSTRLVWWDGLKIGKVPVLDRLRGPGIAPVRFRWKNDGSITDDVGATLEIKSSLGGKKVASIDVPARIVLRDARRSFNTVWADDIPLVGRFEPTLRIKRADGTVVTKHLPAIWVIPSWWYLLALVLAIAVPLGLRRRSKRRYRSLEERVAAAEAAHAESIDDDEWDD